jgi:peptidyl-prolyl cis-trans isomerase B (cyclophilin B)
MLRPAPFLAILLAAYSAAAQDAPKSELTLTLAAEKAEVVIGEDIQVEATLTNASDKALEIAELSFDERSLGFDVTFEASPGKPKTFRHSVVKPDPHLLERVLAPRVSLAPKKSLVALFRIPTLKPGPASVVGVYRGSDKELKSAAVTVKVAPQAGDAGRLAAILETGKGSFQVDLFPEEAPNTVANFVALVRRGFYTNLSFHRVVKGSWVQTGCPYDNGYGGPGYAVRSEAETQTVKHEPGAVAMSGNLKSSFTGSQFYVTLTRITAFDAKYTVFGKVSGDAGLDVVRQIGAVEVDKNTDRPKDDVRVKEIKIVVVK